MNQDQIARGVARALREQEARQAQQTGRSILRSVLIGGTLIAAFLVVITVWGG